MISSPLIPPLLAMIALTAGVWVAMVVQRLGAQKKLGLPIDAFASRASTSAAFGPYEKAANHYMNLFEAPVLFYVLVAVSLATGIVTPLTVTLAWVFVGFRVAHALIHCSYNNVSHRGATFLLGALVLWINWAQFGWALLSSGG
ncbi:MAPEG family protein [Polycyclovorans algicola]|uniref:MAPEG family protein n=1 Tax=Polycyclovorans algicola TaxID=616992 RepID=UPI0009FDAC60|nr:MAPEG family protein [Polycyclovorans algicola]